MEDKIFQMLKENLKRNHPELYRLYAKMNNPDRACARSGSSMRQPLARPCSNWRR